MNTSTQNRAGLQCQTHTAHTCRLSQVCWMVFVVVVVVVVVAVAVVVFYLYLFLKYFTACVHTYITHMHHSV